MEPRLKLMIVALGGLSFGMNAHAVAPPAFVRGDANDDGDVDMADAVYTLAWLFVGGKEPPCQISADVNDDGAIDIADPMSLLTYLFLGTRPPAGPFPEPGTDPTPHGLSCGDEETATGDTYRMGVLKITDPGRLGSFLCTLSTDPKTGRRTLDCQTINMTVVQGKTVLGHWQLYLDPLTDKPCCNYQAPCCGPDVPGCPCELLDLMRKKHAFDFLAK